MSGGILMQHSTYSPNLCASAQNSFLRTFLFALISLSTFSYSWAGNDVLGEVKLKAAGKVEKSAGIWVDGQYLGYLKELKGSKKILLLPGRHEVMARLSGHLDFKTEVDVVAGEKNVVRVAMRESVEARYPDADEMARVKMLINPGRAAVFVNEKYVGHADEFRGFRKSLGLAPGTYKIHVTLNGYQAFETEMTLLKQQEYEIKTKLQKADAAQTDRLTKLDTGTEPEQVAGP